MSTNIIIQVLNNFPKLSAQGSAALSAISQQIAAQGGSAAVIRQLWSLALTELRDPKTLRWLLQFARPGLSAIGIGWAHIEIACLSITGLLASEILAAIGTAVLVIVAGVLVIALLCLILKGLYHGGKALLIFIGECIQWTPSWGAHNPNSQYGSLIELLHSKEYGPIYAIENQRQPTEIALG